MTYLTEFTTYLWAAFGNWWFVLACSVLGFLDVSERMFKKKLPFPGKVRITVAILFLIVAPFLAYHDLSIAKNTEISHLRGLLPVATDPRTVELLVEHQAKAERILNDALTACDLKTDPSKWQRISDDMRRWEDEVYSVLKERIGLPSAAKFGSNTGWTISGRFAMQCPDDNKALELSRFQYKIEILKSLYYR